MIDNIISLICFFFLLYIVWNYISDKRFLKQAKINNIKGVEISDYNIIVVLDEVSCVKCISTFKKLKRKIAYPINIVSVQDGQKLLGYNNLHYPVIAILHKEEIKDCFMAEQPDQTSSVMMYKILIDQSIEGGGSVS